MEVSPRHPPAPSPALERRAKFSKGIGKKIDKSLDGSVPLRS